MAPNVNRPVDLKVKERDVNNKLQLYGIYSAFAKGKAPSNKQIDVALNSFLESKAIKSPSSKLSEEGHSLVADVREVVEAAKVLLLSKNEGNLLQDFIWQTQNIDGSTAVAPHSSLTKDEARKNGDEALEGLRTLGTLIITNGQFRKLLNDASLLLRDIVGDAAQKAATTLQPNEEAMRQIDEPAADNTWHEAPQLNKDKLLTQVKDTWNKNKPVGSKDVKDAAGNASQAANPTGSRDPTDTANLAANQGANSVDASAGAQAAVDTLKAKADEGVSEDAKKTANNYKERSRNYVVGKFPKERREQTIWRLKKMVVEIQGHRDYQRAVETLLDLAERYAGHSREFANQGVGSVKGVHADTALKTAELDLKTLIERFANGTSSGDLFDSINQIYVDADKDPELKGWFKTINAYIRKCLQEQGFVLQDQATKEWNEIYDKGQYLLRNKYRSHTDHVLDEFKFFGNQFDEDAQNKRFGAAVENLFLHLGNDENGKATFKPHLVKDLTEVIIPAIFENVRYVPVPRIEYSDPMIDAVVENLVIESDNLAPNVLEFSSDNHWKWGRKDIASSNKNKVMLAVSGVQLDLRDVSFYINKKQGFPSIKDIGVADIFMGGTGLSFKIAAETSDKTDRTHFFKIGKVDVDVKNVKIKIKKSNHKILLAVAKPILLKVIRPALQKVIEKQIKDSARQLDSFLWDVREEAEKAKQEALRNPDPEVIQNMYHRYANAIQARITRGKEKVKETSEDKKANVAITQHDSIFPDIKLPGGISSKATEYKDLAAKGDKWESPVFSIGSAKESTNIPSAPAILRKPHGTRTIPVATAPGYAGGVTNLSNQLDAAFDAPANGSAYTNGSVPHANGTAYTNGSAHGANGSALGADATKLNGHSTTLGSQNPVLTGQI